MPAVEQQYESSVLLIIGKTTNGMIRLLSLLFLQQNSEQA